MSYTSTIQTSLFVGHIVFDVLPNRAAVKSEKVGKNPRSVTEPVYS
jgi:hypothetical protein